MPSEENWVSWKPEDGGRPFGEWVSLRESVDVIGLRYQSTDVLAFVYGVREAERAGLPWYVQLEREPDNPQDGRAIKVLGAWIDIREGKAGTSRQVHLGYVTAPMAFHLAEAPPTLPLGAELDEIAIAEHENAGFGIRMKINVLVPPVRHPRWGDIVRSILGQ